MKFRILWLCLLTVATLLFSAMGANAASPTDPETVLVTYRATKDKESDLLGVVRRQWQTLRRLNFVREAPHTLVRATDEKGGVYFVEVLTWVSASIPDHAPAEVQAIWAELNKLCEARDGHRGIEITEVEPMDTGHGGPSVGSLK